MKWPPAVILAATMLVGCRSAQQPTNPFLRTTVPPPGTGEAAVVVPGDPYYPGTTPTPTPQPQPITPVPAAPVAPVPAQPVVSPRDQKKPPPGGNYFYHQSSVDRSGDAGPDASQLADDQSGASADDLAINAADPDALPLGGQSNAVDQALALANEESPVDAASFESIGGVLPGESPPHTAAPQSRRPGAPTEMRYSSESGVQILGSSTRDSSVRTDDFDSSSLSRRNDTRVLG